MTDETNNDRSPRAPAVKLEEAISYLKRLHTQIGRSPVKPEVACTAMGYAGMTGSSLTLLAGLSQYGLVSRGGGNVSIAPQSLRILHPTSEDQMKQAIKEAAITPKVFGELYAGYNECSEGVLTSHLVQSGFNLDRAKRVAKVYTANKAFAKLDSAGSAPEKFEEDEEDALNELKQVMEMSVRPASIEKSSPSEAPVASQPKSSFLPQIISPSQKVLAQYTIPLGANQATLVFTGEELSADDFDALVDFVQFSKRQFERAQKKAKMAADFDQATPAAREE